MKGSCEFELAKKSCSTDLQQAIPSKSLTYTYHYLTLIMIIDYLPRAFSTNCCFFQIRIRIKSQSNAPKLYTPLANHFRVLLSTFLSERCTKSCISCALVSLRSARRFSCNLEFTIGFLMLDLPRYENLVFFHRCITEIRPVEQMKKFTPRRIYNAVSNFCHR